MCAALTGVLCATSGSSVNSKVPSVTVKLAVAVLPVASRAVTVSAFVPGKSMIRVAVQLVVPMAVPLPTRSLAHVTRVTPTLSDAVPPSVRSGLLVA